MATEDAKDRLIAELRTEIAELKKQLEEANKKAAAASSRQRPRITSIDLSRMY